MKNILLVLFVLFSSAGCYSASSAEKHAAGVIHEAAFGTQGFDPCANPDPTFPFCQPGESPGLDMCVEPACSAGHVKKLYMYGGNLTELPSEISRLQALERLVLSGNRLTNLPPEIGELHHLEYLDLSGNGLTGLPPEIGQLQNLSGLDLSDNQLTGLPSEIERLQNLTSLDLSHNQLTGFPSELGQIRNLRYLYLSDNRITSLPQEIGHLTRLESLRVDGNPLSGPLSDYLAGLSLLRSFDFSDTNLCMTDDERLQNWYRGIEDVSSYSWKIACSLPEEEQAALLELYEVVGHIKGWTLNTHPCMWSEVTCDWTGHVIWLNLANSQLSALPPEIGDFSRLQILYLDRNRLTDLPLEIGQLESLQWLYLTFNQLTEIPPQIDRLKNLQILDVSFNPLSGPLPRFITDLPQLSLAFERTDLCIPNEDIFWGWFEKNVLPAIVSPGTGMDVPGQSLQQQNTQERLDWLRENRTCGK